MSEQSRQESRPGGIRPPQAPASPGAQNDVPDDQDITGPDSRPPAGPREPGTASRNGRRSLWLGVGALLLVFFAPLGIVVGTAALVIGVRARRDARRAGQPVPGGAVGGIVLGTIGLSISAFSMVVTAIAWNEIRDYQMCMNGANTQADQQECRNTYLPKMERKFHLPPGSLLQHDPLL